MSDLSPDDQKRLIDGRSVSLINYSQKHWYPQLYIENALGDVKEQIRYSAKKSLDDQLCYVCEHREAKGIFWEKLELHHFPSDVQDLSISIASMFFDDKVILMADSHRLSGVNREAFVDQQEWSLYEHVDTEQRFVREFLFHDPDDDDKDNNNIDRLTDQNDSLIHVHQFDGDDRQRSILTVTCHAGTLYSTDDNESEGGNHSLTAFLF